MLEQVATTPAVPEVAHIVSRLSILEGYIAVLAVSFVVALFATPLMRRLAISQGVIDRPSDPRKIHKVPIAYLGGVAVYIGLLAGVVFSYFAVKFDGLIDFHPVANPSHLIDEITHQPVPMSVLLGMSVIVLVGVIDDMTGISPRVKIGGQLFAAAALAADNVGVKLAAGIVLPIAKSLGVSIITLNGAETVGFSIPLPMEIMGQSAIAVDFVYWIGTALIAIGVLGMCNATNLIDGLDGLLSGTTAISAIGLLVIALGLALADDGPRDAQRIILCLALVGACLGFLPHNFNPATIFLGDAGSLLIGFVVCTIIFMLGDTGKTHLVAAGGIVFLLPVIDTALAIVRRKMEGKSISSADDQHLHHMLKRALGVKGAVLALYGIAGSFALLGVAISLVRARMTYVLVLIFVAFIGVTAIKIARRRFIEAQAAGTAPTPTPNASSTVSDPATKPASPSA